MTILPGAVGYGAIGPVKRASPLPPSLRPASLRNIRDALRWRHGNIGLSSARRQEGKVGDGNENELKNSHCYSSLGHSGLTFALTGAPLRRVRVERAVMPS